MLTDNGEFIQYLSYRNSTFFFMNESYTQLYYPQVDDEMYLNVSISTGQIHAPIFNITILAETMFPSIEIISPEYLGEDSDIQFRLNRTHNEFLVRSSDPSGIRNASLYGVFTENSTGLEQKLLFTTTDLIESGRPYNLTIPTDMLETYASLTEQMTIGTVIVNAIIQVDDELGWRTTRYLTFEFSTKESAPESLSDLFVIGGIIVAVMVIAILAVAFHKEWIHR